MDGESTATGYGIILEAAINLNNTPTKTILSDLISVCVLGLIHTTIQESTMNNDAAERDCLGNILIHTAGRVAALHHVHV